MSRIKSSAIPLSGYIYQNYIGLEILCNWLDDPDRYKWVKFEADDEEAPRGLDDVVMTRADGSISLLQVKFTVDPFDEANRLSFEWLSQCKGSKRSLLQKWHAAISKLDPRSVAEVALVTNRRPDRIFESCLDGSSRRLCFEKIPAETSELIARQLGSVERARAFIALFEFRHSHKGFDSLYRTLVDRIVPRHASHHAWLQLAYVAIVEWAVLANRPPPDGRITLAILRSVLDRRRPEPLSQSFRIPANYCPPDLEFHEEFLSRVLSSDRNTSVLWGSPGQGKSTYLSYLCNEFDKRDVPYIRHHYFMSLASTEDRFSLVSVANSLMAQIEARHSAHVPALAGMPEELRDWLTKCGDAYSSAGKRFVVVVDGLDHVWRENNQDRGPLDNLFRHLLPLPENVSLVLGTQKVSSNQLPQSLSTLVGDDNWIELPRMSLASIRSWLEAQHLAQRFELDTQSQKGPEDQLTELASEMQKTSHGHPLHLTYSLETILREHRTVTAELIREIPECPDGDIRRYYLNLWIGLSFQAQDALHLVAGTTFIWPEYGLEDCLNSDFGEFRNEIGHLFYFTEAGWLPFHGSILAFIRERQDHAKRFDVLLGLLTTWLRNRAPSYHRWGWLWLCEARGGNADNLLRGPSRDWVIESLSRGYPHAQVEAILAAAERLAFTKADFALAVRLRWLKIRLLNGIEFQLESFRALEQSALSLSTDEYVLKTLSATVASSTPEDLHLVGQQFAAIGRSDEAEECQEELRKRINDQIKIRAYDRKSLDSKCEQYLDLAAATGRYRPSAIVMSIRGFRSLAPSLFRHFLDQLGKKHDLTAILELGPFPLPYGMRRDLERSAIRLAGFNRAAIHEWPEFSKLRKHPIVGFWSVLYQTGASRLIRFSGTLQRFDLEVRTSDGNDALRRQLHCMFFDVLAHCLSLRGAPPTIHPEVLAKRPWLTSAINHLVKIAINVGALLARGERIGFDHCFRAFEDFDIPKDYEQRIDFSAMKHALVDVSADLFLTTDLRFKVGHVPVREWNATLRATWFDFEYWREGYVSAGLEYVAPTAVNDLVQAKEDEEASRVSQFNERADCFLGLCNLALSQGQDDVARRLLQRASSCVVSYGWRKDMTIFHVLSAIDALSGVESQQCVDWMQQLAPAIAAIDAYTDGDETNHAKTEMANLFLNIKPDLYQAYYASLLKSAEWYEAERVFACLLAKAELEAPGMNLVTDVLWSKYEVGALRDRAQSGDKSANAVISSNARRFGLTEEQLGKEKEYQNSESREEPPVDIEKFGPSSISELLSELNQKSIYVGEAKLVSKWFDYWVKNGKGLEIVTSLKPYLKSTSIHSGISALLDDVFQLSLKLEGKAAAYKWIVAAQIHRHGWDGYWPTQEAIARFRIFATTYRHDWKQFVLDTSRNPYEHVEERLVIPHHRLVQFLVEVGEVQTAMSITDEMVRAVLLEVSDQPLRAPSWLRLQ